MNSGFPIRYVDPVFRPPSEADSLILPLTDGCSWNHCTFCEMYTAPQKKFRARDEAETFETLRHCGERFGDGVRRVGIDKFRGFDPAAFNSERAARVKMAARRRRDRTGHIAFDHLPGLAVRPVGLRDDIDERARIGMERRRKQIVG